MSLLQDVLRSNTTEAMEKMAAAKSPRQQWGQGDDRDDSEDELINVVSLPGTPARSQPSTRPSSPSLVTGAVVRPTSLSSPLRSRDDHTGRTSIDPLRAFSSEVSQRIFANLDISDLVRCSRVSRKWSKSQTINYVWFRHYRKENFHDDSLPPGKWTKRESKQNWRIMYMQSIRRSPPLGAVNPRSRGSGYSSSGYSTPREVKEEKWRLEAEASARPSKLEMREIYKELGGRKARSKGKLGGAGGIRDKGGWADQEMF